MIYGYNKLSFVMPLVSEKNYSFDFSLWAIYIFSESVQVIFYSFSLKQLFCCASLLFDLNHLYLCGLKNQFFV